MESSDAVAPNLSEPEAAASVATGPNQRSKCGIRCFLCLRVLNALRVIAVLVLDVALLALPGTGKLVLVLVTQLLHGPVVLVTLFALGGHAVGSVCILRDAAARSPWAFLARCGRFWVAVAAFDVLALLLLVGNAGTVVGDSRVDDKHLAVFGPFDPPSPQGKPFQFGTWLLPGGFRDSTPADATRVYKTRNESAPPVPGGDAMGDLCKGCSRAWSRDMLLDVWLPRTPHWPRAPILLHTHGGGWTSGDKGTSFFLVAYFLHRGYAWISVQYSLLSYGYTCAHMVEDLEDVVDFLQRRAGDWGLDADRVVMIGASAGGHLAALGGYAINSWLPGVIRGVVNFYGKQDFSANWEEQCGAGRTAEQCDQLANALAGEPFREIGRAVRAPAFNISAVDWIASAVPTLTVHGMHDSLVHYRQGELLHARLDEARVPNLLCGIHLGDHVVDFGFHSLGGLLSRYAVERFLAAVLP